MNIRKEHWVSDNSGNRFCMFVENGYGDLYGSYIPRKTFVFPVPVWHVIAKNRTSGVIPTKEYNIEWTEDEGKFRLWIRRACSTVPIAAEVPADVLTALFEELIHE